MTESEKSRRGELARDAAVFQLKLMADGFRDLVLMPVSLIAALVGVARGGSEPGREFNQVIDLGRQTERWINLFGTHELPQEANPVASIDALVARVETAVKQQYQDGGVSTLAQTKINEALETLHERARQKQKTPSDAGQ